MNHDLLHLFSYAIDVVLIGVGVWMAYTSRELRVTGAMGSTIRQFSLGAIILGIAHFVETVLGQVFEVSFEINELIHRLIILCGFLVLTNGMRHFIRAYRIIVKVKP